MQGMGEHLPPAYQQRHHPEMRDALGLLFIGYEAAA
jgi:hypothetical protein